MGQVSARESHPQVLSFRVRVVRACVRAKLRERVSDVSAQRWRQKLQHFLLRRSGLCGVSVVFAHRWKGFKLFVAD